MHIIFEAKTVMQVFLRANTLTENNNKKCRKKQANYNLCLQQTSPNYFHPEIPLMHKQKKQ